LDMAELPLAPDTVAQALQNANAINALGNL
jgi:hypothetical protein